VLDGEVVNVDPYQAYEGLPILTAAPSLEEQGGVRHHLLGCVPLTERMDAARFRDLVQPVMAEIQGRGKVPICVGGSGMYLKFLTHGSAEVPSGDEAMREKMEGMTIDQIRYELEQLDPEESARLNLDNRRHLSRALEICWLTGKKASVFRSEWAAKAEEMEKNLRGVVVSWPREALVERIERRTREMFAAGVVDEVRAVLERGELDMTLPSVQAIGFSEIRLLIAGEIAEEECREKIMIATRQYAKRQRNWFRKEEWLKAVAGNDLNVDKLLPNFLK